MAHFSRGGWTFPDVLLGTLLLLLILLSTVLNPLVIYHNRRISSLPKLMFTVLASIYILLSLLVGIPAAVQILTPESQPFSVVYPEEATSYAKWCDADADKMHYLIDHHPASTCLLYTSPSPRD